MGRKAKAGENKTIEGDTERQHIFICNYVISERKVALINRCFVDFIAEDQMHVLSLRLQKSKILLMSY